MMNQIFNLIVFLLSASLVNAQYLTPVAFEQSPIWSHYSLVPELNDS
ncbi:MAG: hypothetical protein LC107_00990 [Chitinophagales bacterium]|nr:hypothetical protein [Chitinophagales bacterium]